MRNFLGYLMLALLAFQACSQSQGTLTLNDKAPVIQVGQWLEDTPDLADKVIIIDFWFVNCGPCVASIPHLNKLAKAYEHKEVAFLAITDDSKKKVLEFQERRGISFLTHVGIDRQSRMEKNFGVTAYPQSYIIDKKGMIRWSGSPLSLSSSIINEVLGDNDVDLTSELLSVKNDDQLLVVRESQRKSMISKTDRASSNTVRSVYVGISLQSLIAQLKELPIYLLDVPQEELGKRYDITYENMAYNDDIEGHRQNLLRMILSGLSYVLSAEQSSEEGYLMEIDFKKLSRFEKSRGNAMTNDVSIKGVFNLKDLGLKLSEVFGAVVKVSEAPEVKFNFDLDLTDHEKLRALLQKKYGIDLKSAQIETEKFVVNRLSTN